MYMYMYSVINEVLYMYLVIGDFEQEVTDINNSVLLLTHLLSSLYCRYVALKDSRFAYYDTKDVSQIHMY